ncbi:MAG: hypothetical protein WCP16_13065 [Pseudanabaena sp. ELA645]
MIAPNQISTNSDRQFITHKKRSPPIKINNQRSPLDLSTTKRSPPTKYQTSDRPFLSTTKRSPQSKSTTSDRPFIFSTTKQSPQPNISNSDRPIIPHNKAIAYLPLNHEATSTN